MALAVGAGWSTSRAWRRALAVSSSLVCIAHQALAQDAVGDGCTAERLLKAEAALTTDFLALPGRYPWLQRVSLICNGLAMGSAGEQAAMLSACVARACWASASTASLAVLDLLS